MEAAHAANGAEEAKTAIVWLLFEPKLLPPSTVHGKRKLSLGRWVHHEYIRRSRTSLSSTTRLLVRSLPCALVATGFVASGLIPRRTTHGARSCVICASCATHGRAFCLSSSCIAWSSSTRTNLTGLSDCLILGNYLLRNKCE